MGQPAAGDDGTTRCVGRTRGTETSQYPEEKKTTVIAQVVASERAAAQTGHVTACAGVEGPPITQGTTVSRMFWKGQSERVTTP